ncbi:MAG: hypothetical protein Q8Q08_03340 [Candidatus Omnitrophota bacterium]|nr:hypothetical protein [Candidatus Omnitrophota bacterium]MDZ4243245.1 hypothetical protein [Candidatus Omnitrophota bacterium]
MEIIVLFAFLIMNYLMLIAKRMTALIRTFRLQSLFLGIGTLLSAPREGHPDLYAVALLIVGLKVILIPRFLFNIVQRVKVNDNLGMFVNPQLSIVFGLVFTYAAWIFSLSIVPLQEPLQTVSLTAAFTGTLCGAFLMMFRMKALTQVIGLLVMENGIFLLAASITGGMPFFVEIAIFFDVFVSVIILNVFMQRINRMFTHIDVHKLTHLRG